MIYCDMNSEATAILFIAMPPLRVNLPTEGRSIDYSTNGAIAIPEQFSQDARRCRRRRQRPSARRLDESLPLSIRFRSARRK